MIKIVIIEDDRLVRENVQKILTLEGYDVYQAENGLKGIELIKEETPDLILCDIMLPDMEGYDILSNITKDDKLKTIPFVFLTARAEMSDLRKGMNLGADDYITKPFHIKDLLEVIKVRLEKNDLRQSRTQSNNITEQVINRTLDVEDHLFLPVGSEVQFVRIKNIECITADGVYSYIHTEDGKKIIIRKLLKQWEEILPENVFIRIHKSTIININHINKVEKWFNNSYRINLKMYSEPLIISRRFAAKLKSRLKF